MSETNETEDKTARGGRKMTLNVRRTVESGHVRQSFSHGRSKSVLVEKKKRRAIGAGGAAQAVEEPAAPKPAPRTAETVQKPVQDETPARQARVVLPQLSEEEKDARMRALADCAPARRGGAREGQGDGGAARRDRRSAGPRAQRG